jgi:hypothetical protein
VLAQTARAAPPSTPLPETPAALSS